MKIGIIGAMDVEIAHILSEMESKKETQKAGMTFCEGIIGKTAAVVVRSGVGKVNAALCAQILIDCFGITHLVNSGIAGSLNNDINIGDLVVSTDAVEHDMDATVFGYARGEVPGMGVRSYEADSQLRKTIVETIQITAPEISVFEGTIATGDQFISSKESKNMICDTFHAQCCEMEGGAIAHAAYLNNVPFVIMRYISDKADEEAEVNYPEFEAAAAKHSAELIVSVIRNM